MEYCTVSCWRRRAPLEMVGPTLTVVVTACNEDEYLFELEVKHKYKRMPQHTRSRFLDVTEWPECREAVLEVVTEWPECPELSSLLHEYRNNANCIQTRPGVWEARQHGNSATWTGLHVRRVKNDENLWKYKKSCKYQDFDSRSINCMRNTDSESLSQPLPQIKCLETCCSP